MNSLSRSQVIRFLDDNLPFWGIFFRSHPIPEVLLKEQSYENKETFFNELKEVTKTFTSQPADAALYKVVKTLTTLSPTEGLKAIPADIFKKLDLNHLPEVNIDNFLFIPIINNPPKNLEEWSEKFSHLSDEDFFIIAARFYKDVPGLADMIFNNKSLLLRLQPLREVSHRLNQQIKK